MPQAFSMALWNSASRLETSWFCHRQILLALADGKPDLAESAMPFHLVGAVDSFIEGYG